MPRWPFRRTHDSEPQTTKVAGPGTPAATFSPSQVAALINSVSVGQQIPGISSPLPRTDPMVAFGPGVPLFPAAIDPVRPDTGRPEPRFSEYPVSSNLPGVTDRLVPWKVLRDAADAGGLPRRCIEIRKAEVTTLDWAITITKQAVEAAQADSDRPRAEVEQELRQRLSTEIVRCSTFWERPDPGQDEDFCEWLSKLLEEHLVLDAVAIYPRLTYGGDLYALEILDASTIKVLRDHRGGRPAPPNPAYQQLLWGFPRGEFIADTDADGDLPGGLPADRLVYKRRNARAHTPYGYSAVEQALEDVDVWLRRRRWIRDEYTEGTLPTGYLKNSGAAQWTPSQTAEYETILNDTYSGSSSARHRLRVLPPGMEIESPPDFGEKYRPEYDLFLIKQIAAHFDVTIAELGFTETGGLGSSGWHEGQADVQHRKATLPTSRWLQQLLTSVSRKHLGMPAELEFRFLGLEEEDAGAADEVAAARVDAGRMTYNEDRDRLGLPRYDFPEADMPMVRTARGLVFLDGASKLTPPGELVTPVEGPPLADADADGVLDAPHGPDTDTAVAGEDAGRADVVKAELAAFRRWSRRNPSPSRRFEFTLVTKADAPGLAGDPRIVFAPQGGDARPKDGDRPGHWPGWDRDLATAAVWVPRITEAMTGAVDARGLAGRWLAEQLMKADEPDEPDTSGWDAGDDGSGEISPWAVTAALAFLHRHQITVVPALAVLRLVWLEGYAIGYQSAQSLLNGHERVSTWGWAEGDTSRARDLLPGDVREQFSQWSHQTGRWAVSIGSSRLKALARVLAGGRDQGVAELVSRIRAALGDLAWAHSVAVTEITRASSAAAQDAYRRAGVQQIYWGSELDERACDVCIDNAGAGPLPIGTAWPSGVDAPPQHTSCRCWTYPA
ncbi:phage portal protein [Streptomyces olivoreticuli]